AIPVTFPPGRAICPTTANGSAVDVMTMGMVPLAFLAATVAGVPHAARACAFARWAALPPKPAFAARLPQTPPSFTPRRLAAAKAAFARAEIMRASRGFPGGQAARRSTEVRPRLGFITSTCGVGYFLRVARR